MTFILFAMITIIAPSNISIIPEINSMNDIKIFQYNDYIQSYEGKVVIDLELTNWKSRKAPNLSGMVFKDTTSTNAIFLVISPGQPVIFFSSELVFKNYISTVKQKSREKKSSYYGLVESEEKFFTSLENVHVQLANHLDISHNLLDYSLESVSILSSRLEELPTDYDFYDKKDSTLFLIIKYIGSTIYKLRKESWSFRNQVKYGVKIPNTVIVGVKAQEYDWFAALTSVTVEKEFEKYKYIVESAANF
jgi:hypothetical protein